jgi:RNA polymerase sigma-70 factor (ECF subfamily)
MGIPPDIQLGSLSLTAFASKSFTEKKIFDFETFGVQRGLTRGGRYCQVNTREAEWVRRAQGGDTNAFAMLVSAHQQFVYNLALRAVGNPQDAEDIAQDVFVRAWLGLPRFRGQSQFRTWLYRIAVNVCYKRLPRLRRDMEAWGDDEAVALPAESFADLGAGIEAEERRQFLHQQIEALPASYKLLVTLRFQQELPYEEIAQVMDMPLGTVKTGLFRARAHLREALRKFEEEER